MAEHFQAAVKDGLRLSKRIYFGNDRTVAPPKPIPAMERSAGYSYLPTSPMLYAVISNPEIVDNPDMPSYQPYVYGKCDPPALMPLQMNRISLEVDCCMDTAVVTVNGSWRVHCVMGSRSCDCSIAVPMGEQGSILGVEVEVPMKSYCTQLAAIDNEIDTLSEKKGNADGKEKAPIIEDEPYLNPHIFTITVPKIDGGTNLSVKLRWSQKLIYHNGQFTLQIPFSFPEYVTPTGKKTCKHEKIQINVNSGPGTEILCNTMSHPLKEQFRRAGKQGFLYDADVLSWSKNDLVFSYTISSSDTFGTAFLSPPASLDVDGRERFCCCLFPGKKQDEKVFRREVVFIVDISGSMKGKLLEDTKNALFAALAKLRPEDLFNVIAFNSETYLFSSSLHPAAAENIEKATEWINLNFVAGGGTNILLPLNQAIEMLSDSCNSIPVLLLITDGAVEDERHICDIMKNHLTNRKNFIPRIYTLGIGKFCNHYFLRMLALLGGGHHEVANDVDSVMDQIGRLFDRASSIILADIAFENLDDIDGFEVFPSRIPNLSAGKPLIVSGRYRGAFPETLKLKGTLPNMSNISVDLKVQDAKEDILIGKMLAKQEIELLTVEAWYSDRKELKEKITELSVQNAVASEYTDMILFETLKRKTKAGSATAPKKQKVSSKVADSHGAGEDPKPQKILVLHNIGLGFGNPIATEENVLPTCCHYADPTAAAEADAKCCGQICNHCCCMGCIQACSKMNDQFAVALTQLCGGLACLGCFSCCSEICCDGQDG